MIVHVAFDAYEAAIEGTDMHERLGLSEPWIHKCSTHETAIYENITADQARAIAGFLDQQADWLLALPPERRDGWLSQDVKVIRNNVRRIRCLLESSPE